MTFIVIPAFWWRENTLLFSSDSLGDWAQLLCMLIFTYKSEHFIHIFDWDLTVTPHASFQRLFSSMELALRNVTVERDTDYPMRTRVGRGVRDVRKSAKLSIIRAEFVRNLTNYGVITLSCLRVKEPVYCSGLTHSQNSQHDESNWHIVTRDIIRRWRKKTNSLRVSFIHNSVFI